MKILKRVDNDYTVVEVEPKEFKEYGKAKVAIIKYSDGWSAVEYKTGLLITFAKTKKQLLADLEDCKDKIQTALMFQIERGQQIIN